MKLNLTLNRLNWIYWIVGSLDLSAATKRVRFESDSVKIDADVENGVDNRRYLWRFDIFVDTKSDLTSEYFCAITASVESIIRVA